MRYAPLEGSDTGAPTRHRVQRPVAPQARADSPLLRPRGARRRAGEQRAPGVPGRRIPRVRRRRAPLPAFPPTWPKAASPRSARAWCARRRSPPSAPNSAWAGALYLGHGEETSGGRTRERNLARTFEAVLGAILLDQGYAKAKRWTLKQFKDRLESLPPDLIDDYKSLLQERVQAEGHPPPVYRTIKAEGPDHSRDFTVEVIVGGAVAGEGVGPSKQKAEREAARAAMAQPRPRLSPCGLLPADPSMGVYRTSPGFFLVYTHRAADNVSRWRECLRKKSRRHRRHRRRKA